MTLLVFSGSILISCGGDGGDTPPPPPVEDKYINVNGVGSTDISFAGTFNNKGGESFKQYITVVSNTPWSISGAPDWLSISPSNGNGTVQIEMYPKSENSTATARTATITLTGDNASATINVRQEAGKPLCIANIANEVALHNSICWEYSIDGEVNTFQTLILSENEYKRMTDKEIIEEISKQEVCKYIDQYLTSTGIDSHNYRITGNSVYYIITLATNDEGKTGELTKKMIRTPEYKNATNDAWVQISDPVASSLSFQFNATKKGYCNTYNVIYGASDDIKPNSVYAFEINYYKKYNKKHWLAENLDWEITLNYPNNNTFTYTSIFMLELPYYMAYAQGVFKDGSISSDVTGFVRRISNGSAAQLSKAQQDAAQAPTTIKRSEVEKIASKLSK